MEEATFRGINFNATVCFTVSQAIAVAEAVERGLNRRAATGIDTSYLTQVCTMMIGRLHDWIKTVAKKGNILTTPGRLDWAGIAVMEMLF